jgi:hypothetical protein
MKTKEQADAYRAMTPPRTEQDAEDFAAARIVFSPRGGRRALHC